MIVRSVGLHLLNDSYSFQDVGGMPGPQNAVRPVLLNSPDIHGVLHVLELSAHLGIGLVCQVSIEELEVKSAHFYDVLHGVIFTDFVLHDADHIRQFVPGCDVADDGRLGLPKLLRQVDETVVPLDQLDYPTHVIEVLVGHFDFQFLH